MKAASREKAERTGRTTLCCVDGSPASWRALEFACDLARSGRGRLVVLCIAPPGPFSREMQEYARLEHFGEDADPLLFEMMVGAVLNEARTRAAERGCGGAEFLGRRGEPAQTILAVAAEVKPAQIVLGRRRRPELVAAVLGSVSRDVVKGATYPCTIVSE